MPRRNRGPHLVWLEARSCYYISYTEAGRSKRRSTGTDDRAEAESQLLAFLAEGGGRGAGDWRPRDPAEFPVTDALEAYAVEHGPATAAPDRIGYALDALLPFWQGRAVADVTRETCKAYGRERRRAPATVRRELGTLRAAINHAHREGRLTRPVTVFLPPKPEGKDRWLTTAEAAALLRAARRDRRCRLHLPLFIVIGLYTGARKEAILSLRWPQVDLERGRIDFNPPGRTRTAKGRPVIPIPRRLAGFLRRARPRSGELGYVVNRDGRPIGDVKRSFATAAIRAGLRARVIDQEGRQATDRDGKPLHRATVSPHVLRHTSGTWMAQRGVPLFEIAGYLGHGHARTAELYSHHSPDHLARARAALDR